MKWPMLVLLISFEIVMTFAMCVSSSMALRTPMTNAPPRATPITVNPVVIARRVRSDRAASALRSPSTRRTWPPNAVTWPAAVRRPPTKPVTPA
ncbi:hypothetical protein [Streptomyces achromogenes]|uniref:hypothetical protein n=1 Tax=Streptomyces achromogenes TaxID=67255 RepID=UPI0027D791CF|nr:hypothetical protein [Streptomyces achromogenes]